MGGAYRGRASRPVLDIYLFRPPLHCPSLLRCSVVHGIAALPCLLHRCPSYVHPPSDSPLFTAPPLLLCCYVALLGFGPQRPVVRARR